VANEQLNHIGANRRKLGASLTSPMTPRFTHPVLRHVLRPSSASDNSQPLAAKGLLYAN
jgi:hypothetical protein